MQEYSLQARAKVNLTMDVLRRRPDGYHEVDLLMQSVSLCDTLTVRESDGLSLDIEGDLPVADDNLVLRAARLLAQEAGIEPRAEVLLVKRIPVAAGLGGGSADCAMTLIALNRLWNLRLPLRTLQQIGLKLGADVPFCLQQGMARAEGVGEILTPLESPPMIPLVMVTPGGGLSTPAVFKAWSAGNYPMSRIDNLALAGALKARDFARAQALSCNDLETPAIALMPEIGALIDRFRSLGAAFVRMTGSGSTVFAAFESEEAARRAADAVPGAILTRTTADPL